MFGGHKALSYGSWVFGGHEVQGYSEGGTDGHKALSYGCWVWLSTGLATRDTSGVRMMLVKEIGLRLDDEHGPMIIH